MRLLPSRPIRHPVFLVSLAVAAFLASACSDSGEKYRDIDAGRLAPPGATLVQEYAQDGGFEPSSYVREYRSSSSPTEVNEFYAEALRDEWVLVDTWTGGMQWESEELRLGVAHDQKDIKGSHWSVSVGPAHVR